MGLSNQERIEQMIWGIGEIVRGAVLFQAERKSNLVRNWEIARTIFTEIRGLANGFLCGESRGLFWVFGSEASQDVTWTRPNLWSVSIRGYCEDRIEMPESGGMDVDVRYFFEIRDLLRKVEYDGEWLAYVHNLYGEIEGVLYALNRYDDEFRNGFSDLERTLNYLMFLCGSEFQTHNGYYAKAYVINQVVGFIYGGDAPRGGDYPFINKRKNWGKYVEVLEDLNLNHRMYSWMGENDGAERDFRQIMNLHKDLMQRRHENRLMTKEGQHFRFLCALALCRFNGYHAEEIREKLGKYKLEVTKEIEEAIQKCVKWQEEHEEQSKPDKKHQLWEDLSLYKI